MRRRLLDLLNDWRRKTFPASEMSVQLRHEFLIKRLADIESLIATQIEVSEAVPAVQSEVLAVLRLLEPKRAAGCKKVRLGRDGDGGYVQINDLEGISRAVSAGICDDDSWDLAMAKAGVPVEQFDHSITAAPSVHPLLRFHRKMLSTHASRESVRLADIAAEYTKRERPDLILKMDIEGCEWDIFDDIDEASLGRFSQIICEFHNLSHLGNDGFRARAHRVFEKLARHFALVHVHANNCSKICILTNIPVPDVLELSFASRSRYVFVDSDEKFPTLLDAPNEPSVPDIVLGAFRF